MYNWPQRKNLRLSNYDYSQNGLYFVTICTKNREDYFGEIVKWEMILNEYWKIAEKCWNEIPMHYMKSQIDYFIIMPNHIHWIIIIENININLEINPLVKENYLLDNNNPNHKTNLSNIIKWFKIWCTKEIKNNYNDNVFWWQKSFYDVIIRNEEQLNTIRQYIIDNPKKWEFENKNIDWEINQWLGEKWFDVW